MVAVFQPHRYTRTAALWRDFADAFAGADAVVLTDMYPAGEQPQPGVSGRLVLRAVLDAHPEQAVTYLPRRADLVARTCPRSPGPATSCSPSAPAISPPPPTSGWRSRHERGESPASALAAASRERVLAGRGGA